MRRFVTLNTGYTLIELLFVVALLAIIASAAVLNGRKLLANRQISTVASALLATTQQARATALTEAKTVVVCPSTNGTSCGAEADWQAGWISWIDDNGNGVRDAEDQLLTLRSVTESIILDVPRAVASGFHFSGSGRPSFDRQITIGVCDERGVEGPAQAIIYSVAGLGSMLNAEDAGLSRCG
jgi:type IV fimbrial biogenesis protein FimT